MEDTAIIDLYFARDTVALRETDSKYGKQLFTLADHLLNNREDAEECLNDTYFGAWNSIPPHAPREHFFAYLARIARCGALDICRRRSATKRQGIVVELSDELAACLVSGERADRLFSEERLIADALNAFLQALDKETRAVFLRRYFYADSIREIAARFAMRESKVKSMLMRTREKLRVHLAAWEVL